MFDAFQENCLCFAMEKIILKNFTNSLILRKNLFFEFGTDTLKPIGREKLMLS